MKRRALTDEQCELIEPLIPRSEANTDRPARDRRLMLDGAFWDRRKGDTTHYALLR